MLRTIDTWIGKHLFVPIIIRICQMTGATQYAFATYTFIFELLLGICFWKFSGLVSILAFIFISSMTLYFIVNAALYNFGIMPSGTVPFLLRIFTYPLLIINLTDLLDDTTSAIVFIVRNIALIAVFFAVEIDTIPPKDLKEEKKEMSLIPQKIKS